MPTKTIPFDPTQKPEQFWRMVLGGERDSSQLVMADAILLDPITPKMGGRGNVHQHILVLRGSNFKYSTDSSCKRVYADKRQKIESLYLDANGELDRPILFSSLSAASCVLNGSSKDGRDLWHLQIGDKETGLTFDQASETSLTLIGYTLPPGMRRVEMLTSD